MDNYDTLIKAISKILNLNLYNFYRLTVNMKDADQHAIAEIIELKFDRIVFINELEQYVFTHLNNISCFTLKGVTREEEESVGIFNTITLNQTSINLLKELA